jgi:beta-glucosidase
MPDVKKMTIHERVRLLSGRDGKQTQPISRLGVPSITLVDGPHCARRLAGALDVVPGESSTCFPTGTGMGASWDVDLIKRIGQALGRETIGVGAQVLLGPTINIIRHPLAGRSFECLSEDPQLTAALATAYIHGVQAQGVGTCVKHFACNNQEAERYRVDVRIDQRTLRELYLPAFEAAVCEAGAWSIMAAYNRLNGQYCCQSQELLRQILIEEWGFDGVVVTDWGALHACEQALAAGCHLEMPGPGVFYGRNLADAVEHRQVPVEHVDDAAGRVLHLVERCTGQRAAGEVDSARHRALALEAAENSMVLLKNTAAALPLRDVSSIAVLGPNAAETQYGGGGSSCGQPPYLISVLDGLRECCGDRVVIRHEPGCDNYDHFLPPVPADWFPDGLQRSQWSSAWEQDATLCQQDSTGWINDWYMPARDAADFMVRWTGDLVVPANGCYRFVLDHCGVVQLRIDETILIDDCLTGPPIASERSLPDATIELSAGRRYRLGLVYRNTHAQMFTHCKLMATRLLSANERQACIQQAVAVVRDVDAAVVVVGGIDNVGETEGIDRRGLGLPGDQDELIRAVAAANPRTVVLLNRGGPSLMPWLNAVPAVMQTWFAGQEVGRAAARILMGDTEPGGRLPMRFPASEASVGAEYPGDQQLAYTEGCLVGYRYDDHAGIEPLFPFGHGLGYTEFELTALAWPETAVVGEDLRLGVRVRNLGNRGRVVLQCYASWPDADADDPVRELVGFGKWWIEENGRQDVEIVITARALRRWRTAGWLTPVGEYRFAIGCSSRDLRLIGTVAVIR